MNPRSLTVWLLGLALWNHGGEASAQKLPPSIHSEGVPKIPEGLDPALDRYRFDVVPSLQGWLAGRRNLLYLGGHRGTRQVFVVREPGGDQTLLTDFGSPVSWIVPHPGEDRFVTAMDRDGNERFDLSLHELDGSTTTRFVVGRCENRYPMWSSDGSWLAFSSDARNGKDMDIYLIRPPDVTTGRRLTTRSGYAYVTAWSPDDRQLVVGISSWEDQTTAIHLIDAVTGADTPIPTGGASVWSARFAPDGRSLYWITNRDSDYTYLARFDLDTKNESRLSGETPWDVSEYDLSSDGTALIMLINQDGRSILKGIDPRSGKALEVPRFADGMIWGMNFRPHSHEFAFTWSNHRVSSGSYSYDLETHNGEEWIKPRNLDSRAGKRRPAEMIRYRSFDGLAIPAYVTRPPSSHLGRRPVLIDIHGGPASQYRPGYSAWEEFLSIEYGLAIIHPNVRGSSGYGRNYERLDDGFLREDAVKDIGALLDWIAIQPDLDASRVAVRGGSYGGYMSLASLVRFGDRLRAGIDLAGISDFLTELRTDPPSSLPGHRREYGDERDPETERFLHWISPLANAREIRRPLLVIHGKSDPRVRFSEAEQIVAEVRKNGFPIWSIGFDGEGHNFQQRHHAIYAEHAETLFLKRFLIDARP